MRKAILVIAFFGLTGLVWAQDPSIGTWKLNIEKSTLPPSSADVKESIIVMRMLNADTYESISTDTLKDGKVEVTKWTVPKTGGIQTYQQGGPEKGISIVAAKIDEYTIHNIYLQNGKQVFLMKLNISKDGKTMTGSATIPNPKGKPQNAVWQFDRK
jgi:hypothetical protein